MLDIVRDVISSDQYISAAMITMAVFLLPAYKTKLGDKSWLVTGFIAHLIIQLSPIKEGSPYAPYAYAMLIDVGIFLLCLVLAYRGLILIVGLLSLGCVAINLFQVCCLIANDGDITSSIYLDFVYETRPYILLVTILQTLLLAYETYGRDLKRHMVLLFRRYTPLLPNSMDAIRFRKDSSKANTET